MKAAYFDSVVLIERLYRLYLDVLKAELKRIGIVDINNVQTMILYHIGDNQITVGELINRGYYMGSNVSYNLKKLMQAGYVEQKQSEFDKRSSFVNLTKKGRDLRSNLDKLIDDQMKVLSKSGLDAKGLDTLAHSLKNLENCFNKFSRGDYGD